MHGACADLAFSVQNRVRPGGTRWPWSSGLRWPNLVLASAADNGEAAGKGFGIPKKGMKPAVKKGGSSKGDEQQKGVLLNNAARTADREGSAQLSKVIDVVDKKVSRLRVDPDEAKKGKLLESKGEIAVAQVKPLPSFDRWRCGSGDEEAIALGGAARAALDADITSYAKYLRQLGSSSLGNDGKAKDACLKLLAHVFTNYVSHLTTGMRIGAKAMDNIVLLRQTNGVSFYRDYQLEGKEPLQLFIQTMNSAGLCVSCDDDHEQVMEELPKAMQRTSVLLSVLAVEEQALVVSE
ncbi:hypothetical protein R1flu_001030 [Riccia fluitans]|uniref:Uncharacterized protein n=1 Tax=Riccia fluitans TaxID=41844 RepID=A0ABD1Y2J6_9MARC